MQERLLMERALTLARCGQGAVSPNPLVGAVVVKRGTIVAEGFHARCGGDHAEAVTLKKAGKNANGATLVVTLEPCCHTGKTPPCTEAIIRAGIRRVVCAMEDPNPIVSGKGLTLLRKNHINVTMGILEKEAKRLNEIYCTFIKTGRPFVALKMAISLDGKIATKTGESKWITGPSARKKAHELRAIYDAVLVGKHTVLRDNPRLDVRHVKGQNPWRVVLDTRLEIPETAQVFRDAHAIVFTTDSAEEHKRRLLERRGITIYSEGKTIWPNGIIERLGKIGVASLLVEGGATVFTSFLSAGVVNRIYAFIAPCFIGGEGKSVLDGKGIEHLRNAWRLSDIDILPLSPDLLVTGLLRKHEVEKRPKRRSHK